MAAACEPSLHERLWRPRHRHRHRAVRCGILSLRAVAPVASPYCSVCIYILDMLGMCVVYERIHVCMCRKNKTMHTASRSTHFGDRCVGARQFGGKKHVINVFRAMHVVRVCTCMAYASVPGDRRQMCEKRHKLEVRRGTREQRCGHSHLSIYRRRSTSTFWRKLASRGCCQSLTPRSARYGVRFIHTIIISITLGRHVI